LSDVCREDISNELPGESAAVSLDEIFNNDRLGTMTTTPLSEHVPHSNPQAEVAHRPLLRTRDVVSLILGIVVGVSIFRVPGDVFSLAGEPEMALFIWGLGAFLAFCGALCYCELAAAWPEFGGEYVYLARAFGSVCAFLFAWMTIFTVLPGNIGAAAFILADYAGQLHPTLASSPGIVAAVAILGLTALQLVGFVAGRATQNLLTVVKVLALGTVLMCGFVLPAAPAALPVEAVTSGAGSLQWSSLGLALVFVLYAYGGWNDAAMVTPEVENCRRNMPRALLLGLLLIAALYLALNYGFWRVLGVEGAKHASAPAAAVIEKAWGISASRVMSLIVMFSALGAMNGMMFAGCRLLSAVGRDAPVFRYWNHWNVRQVPVWSLLTLSALSLSMTVLVGLPAGRQLIDTLLTTLSLSPPNWEFYGGGFHLLVAASAPVFWVFFFLSAFALIVLRWKEPDRPRPFRVPFYPIPVLIFLATSGYMFWSSVNYAGRMTVLLSPILLIGIVVAFIGCGREKRLKT